MRIEELELRYNNSKRKLEHYKELTEFWRERLNQAIELDLKEENFDAQLIIDTINALVSDYYDIVIDIRDKTRERRTLWGRKFYCFYVRNNYPNVPLQAIAETVNLDNHATIINAVHTHRDLIQYDPEYQKLCKFINNKLQGKII